MEEKTLIQISINNDNKIRASMDLSGIEDTVRTNQRNQKC